MSDHTSPGDKLYREGWSTYESYLTSNATSESELMAMLDHSIGSLERALKSELDPTTEILCRAALGIVLFEKGEASLDFVANSGLGKFPELDRAVTQLETALRSDAERAMRVFFDRAQQIKAILRLDAVWQRQSVYVKNQFGPEKKLSYLGEKLNLLDYLGGVRPPGLCLSLAFHYRDAGDRGLTLEWLKNAAEADDYGDLDNKSFFYENAHDNRQRAQKGIAEMSAPKKTSPAPVEKKSGGGCFIATAAYGSPDAPEVLVFRRSRDEVLLASAPGRAGVRLYYRLSPPLAAFISRGSFLRAVTKAVLLRPILSLLERRREAA